MTMLRHPALVLAAAVSAPWVLIGALLYLALTRM
jgi:hypothetical protein